MQLHYDEDFIEGAVFLCARGRRSGPPPLQISRFHREREKLYGILDPDARNAAFFRLHLDWFREWGLDQPLTEALAEHALVRRELDVLAVRKTTRRNEEGAELHVNADHHRTGVVALRLERLTDAAALRDYLRHEFTHLHDMLDPAFGYSPELELPRVSAAQQRLARERYRLLWDITIDGRLTAAGHPPRQRAAEHLAAFARGYAFWPERKRSETFAALWHGRAPRHALLVGLIADPRGLQGTPGPAPGAPCPLCDFPTFHWADAGGLPSPMLQQIGAEFPRWSAEQGLCQRCFEAYHTLTGGVVTAST